MENHNFVMGKLTKYLQFSMSRSVKLPEGRLGWFIIWIFMDHPYTSTWMLCFFVYGSPIIDMFWLILMDHLGSPKNTTRYHVSSGGLWIVWFLPHNLAIAADHCRSVAFQAKHQTSTFFQSTSECAAASGTSFWRVGCVFLPTTLIWWTPGFLLHHRQTPQQGLPNSLWDWLLHVNDAIPSLSNQFPALAYATAMVGNTFRFGLNLPISERERVHVMLTFHRPLGVSVNWVTASEIAYISLATFQW